MAAGTRGGRTPGQLAGRRSLALRTPHEKRCDAFDTRTRIAFFFLMCSVRMTEKKPSKREERREKERKEATSPQRWIKQGGDTDTHSPAAGSPHVMSTCAVSPEGGGSANDPVRATLLCVLVSPSFSFSFAFFGFVLVRGARRRPRVYTFG